MSDRTQAGWNDLVQEVTVKSGSNAPTLSSYRDGLLAYAFDPAVMNECFATFHIRHDYAADGGDVGYEGMLYPLSLVAKYNQHGYGSVGY